MSLGLFLLRDIASAAHTAASAAQIASSVVTIKNINNINRARAQAMGAQQASGQSTVTSYEVDLFLAKVAMLSYIAKADHVISPEEQTELDQSLAVAEKMYGREATARARQIFASEGQSFIALEPYLRKVQDRDLDSFLFYSEEYAKTDNELTPEEATALQKLRTYIDSRKGKKSFENLTCPSCGAGMRPDVYGYKAACEHCGYEIVLNTDNSPYRVNSQLRCSSCGATYDNSIKVNFCRYCGGKVISLTEQTNPRESTAQPQNGSNLFISYTSNNSRVGLVTRIVSTGMKNTYTNGQTLEFNLAPGRQTIVLKIGKKNYNREIVILPSNSPVRIYASYDGRGHISIDQPTT